MFVVVVFDEEEGQWRHPTERVTYRSDLGLIDPLTDALNFSLSDLTKCVDETTSIHVDTPIHNVH